jgi:hemerythrin
MRAPVWDESLKCGIPAIDAEHRQLIEAMNDLYVACYINPVPDDIRAFTERLIEATKAHFAHEEAEMRRVGHPDLEGHRAEHRELLRDITGIRDHCTERLDATSAQHLLDHLRGWLIVHIQTYDRNLGPAMTGTARTPTTSP